MSIPKIIHLVEPAHNVLSVWQNTHPDWQCIEWTIEGCYAFLKRYYPEAEEHYLSLSSTSQRIHTAWYYLLHRYGGVVVEGNRVPKKKIEALFLSLYDLYLIEDWFIASAPGTDFLQDAIETLPTLQPKWYTRFLGERRLVRDTAMVLPETPFKRHPWRVYHNYFQTLQTLGISKWKIFFLFLLLFIVFQILRIVTNKDKLQLWKYRWMAVFPPKRAATPYVAPVIDTVVEDVAKASPISDILPPLTVLKGISLESLEKKLNLLPKSPQSLVVTPLQKIPSAKVPPAIRIPPLHPDTPSSISSSLVITPFSMDELEIEI
jgi:hypothetical protein